MSHVIVSVGKLTEKKKKNKMTYNNISKTILGVTDKASGCFAYPDPVVLLSNVIFCVHRT